MHATEVSATLHQLYNYDLVFKEHGVEINDQTAMGIGR